MLWAREQVAAGDFDTAVRSFRQALVATREPPQRPAGSAAGNLELAAILFLAGREQEGLAQALGQATALALEQLPDWARSELQVRGIAHTP